MKQNGSFDMSALLKATQDIKKVRKKIDKSQQNLRKLELKKQGIHKVFVNLLIEQSKNVSKNTITPKLRPVRATQRRKRDNNLSLLMSKLVTK